MKFFAPVREALVDLGYQPLEGQSDGPPVVYKEADRLILTLGLEKSNRYMSRFTGSFFLSRSFVWAYMLPGFPREAYQRVGNFLRSEERKRLLSAEFQEPGVVDAWWVAADQGAVNDFIEAVRIAEPRFLGQPDLQKRILACEALSRHVKMADEVSLLAQTLETKPGTLRHQPARTAKEVLDQWYWAAELVLNRYESVRIKSSWVALLAVDAWRLAHLSTSVGNQAVQ